MADQADKKAVRKAVQKIASTEAGVLFFRYLKEICHYEFTTLSGDVQSHEVNPLATIGREFERKIYLNVRQAFTDEQKIDIEVKQNKTKQPQEGDTDGSTQ